MRDVMERSDKMFRGRMLVVGSFLSFVFAAVMLRAIHLHTSPQDSLQWIAQKQYQAVVPTSSRRAKITDSKGRDLAVSLPVQSIFADPSSVADPKATLDALEEVLPLGSEREKIERRMHPDRKFAWIKRRVSPEVAKVVQDLALPGLHFIEESLRVYPNGDLASQLLGAVGFDSEPLAGLELAYNKYIQSKKNKLINRRDARGRVYFSPTSFNDQGDVGTMTLTIDKITQYITEMALQRAYEESKAEAATAIVMDVETGRILAISNRPTFDPNEYYKFKQDSWRNRAITDAYEPGSTFKVLVASAAIEAGVSPSRKYFCENGRIHIGRAVLRDSHPHGTLSVSEIIQVSSNIGTLKMAQEVGKDRVAAVLGRFGIGRETGVDFPGEVSGILRPVNSWKPIEFATIAFGQGLTTTPLQMTASFAAIANGGRRVFPYLVDRITSRDGEVLYTNDGEKRNEGSPRVISEQTAFTVRKILQSVVEQGGTGMAAASNLYQTAGKTGTAQKVGTDGRGYEHGKYFASFVGFAPADKPRIAVFVGIDVPQGRYYGGQVAAPVFKEIIEGTLQYMEVPTSGAPVIMTKKMKPRKPDGSGNSQSNVKFDHIAEGKLVVPDLKGLSMRHVIRLANSADVQLELLGSGIVVSQNPPAGSVIGEDRAVRVKFKQLN